MNRRTPHSPQYERTAVVEIAVAGFSWDGDVVFSM